MALKTRATKFLGARLTLISFVILLVSSLPAAAEDRLLLRISVENVPSHFQAQMVRRFSELVAERSKGSLVVEFYDGAKLYRDADVVTAIARGDVEMAVPGIWQFDRSVPATAALMLPSTFGRRSETMRALVDGALGRAIDARVESALSCVVIGGWLDLGGVAIFSRTRPLTKAADFVGLKIRVAGGRGNEERMRALGAFPVAIPSPDLPSFLDNGLVDALLSTWETVASAGLDAHGLRFAFADNEYYPFYIPIVNAAFWKKLSGEQRALLADTWSELLPKARETAVAAQAGARDALAKRGLRIELPDASTIESIRASLMAKEDRMAARLGVSAEMLELLRSQILLIKSGAPLL
ncbi:MAG TPA: TRAP transporter substrate-binding protein DctP [Rectinemataceae bacterium]|nr:TRAP transporter substrate-binding protein DctP [Rectinemataceae bacterium]